MPGLTPFGTFHTVISLVAVAAGAVALIRDKAITWNNIIGKIYVVMTVLTCITGFFIFHHGGFGKPHVLGIITLVVIAVAIFTASKNNPFGKLSPYISTIGYSMTFFFHFIPAITETSTRLPVSAPLAASPDDPRIQAAVGVCFLLFLIGATLQVRKLKSKSGIVIKEMVTA